jgi:spore coat polysaccharide biosynthesis protein SpsF
MTDEEKPAEKNADHKKTRVICVSQARMTSSRLPGKVMKEVLGQPLIYYHLSRLMCARLVDRLVVATTVNKTDDILADYAESLGISVFRGDEQDVLGRYEGAVQAYGNEAQIVVRVTSDCPLIDPEIVDGVIEAYLAGQPELDYIAVDNSRFPRGLDVEVFRKGLLSKAAAAATDPAEREHVTPFIYRRPQQFSCDSYSIPENYGSNRWCVDEPADFELIRRILEAVYPINPTFTWRDCMAILDENPEWRVLNAVVQQKPLAPLS